MTATDDITLEQVAAQMLQAIKQEHPELADAQVTGITMDPSTTATRQVYNVQYGTLNGGVGTFQLTCDLPPTAIQ